MCFLRQVPWQMSGKMALSIDRVWAKSEAKASNKILSFSQMSEQEREGASHWKKMDLNLGSAWYSLEGEWQGKIFSVKKDERL